MKIKDTFFEILGWIEYRILGLVTIAAIITIFTLALGAVFLDGKAKQFWLKNTQGIDVPWYYANSYQIEINSVDAKVKEPK